MPNKPALYPLQSEGVNRFLAGSSTGESQGPSAPLRYIFAWGTGCGKTAGALTAIAAVRPRRVLIVCPAVVRRHWLREIEKWAPSWLLRSAVIEYGRHRRLPKKKSAERDASYEAACQIVSYDLIKQVDLEGWDMIVLDELHHVAAPTSQQSGRVQVLLEDNPRAHVLGLSATLIPTEAKQLWNPLRLLFGEHEWGRRAKAGDLISWQFKRRYCHLEKNEYGIAVSGCLPAMRPELRARLHKVAHVLTREMLAQDLPPLNLNVLELALPLEGHPNAERRVEALVRWANEQGEDVEKLCILVHHREYARQIYHALQSQQDFRNRFTNDGFHFEYIDGATQPFARDAALIRCAMAPKAVLVGTHGALSEGIRLMWVQQAAIDEWSQSPGRVIQLLGRFNSVGSSLRPQVNLISTSDTYGAAQELLARVEVVQDVLTKGSTDEKLAQLLSNASELSEGQLKMGWSEMFSSANLSADRTAWSDETEVEA